jgi:hypothetical protein
MPCSILRSIAALAACTLAPLAADAADIRVDPSGGNITRAVIEGKIEVGDFEKFKNFILARHDVIEIYLASPGGYLGEAMKIGILIRFLKLSTVVPSKVETNQNFDLVANQHKLKGQRAAYMCASACFFVFVAGIHRSSDVEGPAILGIHRPFLADNELKGVDQAAAENRTRTTVENYLKAMNVPAKYAEDMYFVPKGKTQWIRYDEFESDLAGFIPELRDWVKAKCDVARKNQKEPTQFDCAREVESQLAIGGYADALEGSGGGIPQIFLGREPASRQTDKPGEVTPSGSVPLSTRGSAFPSSQRGPAFPQSAPAR